MPDLVPATATDLALRGGVAMALLLLAAMLLRDQGRSSVGRLGAFLAVSVAGYAICSAAGVHRMLGAWAAPVMILSAGDIVVFWLFAQALFDDDFRLRPWHAALWAAMVSLGLIGGLGLAPGGAAETALGLVMTIASAGFGVLAAVQTLASWSDDLVEPRRRLRVFIVAAGAGFAVLSAAASLLVGKSSASTPVSLAEALGLAAIVAPVVWALLRVNGDEALFGRQEPGLAPTAAAQLSTVDAAVLAELETALSFDRVYRQERLTIGALAMQLRLPEHRLRRLINQGLGQRNFNAFLNGYRIADAKAALVDPEQDEVSVLTIALDAGFSSLGPFNRAFKAATGLTPTAYRRARGAGPAEFEFGEGVLDSARPAANSA